MTAAPLFEIARALCATLVREYPDNFRNDEAIIDEVLTYCAKEFQILADLEIAFSMELGTSDGLRRRRMTSQRCTFTSLRFRRAATRR